MRWKRYPEDKQSKIPWVRRVPKQWQIRRIKHTTYVKGRIGWKGLKSDEFIDEGPYLVTGTDFVNGKVQWGSCYHVTGERYEEDPFIQLQENDLLITKDGTIGKTAIVKNLPGRACLNSGIFLLRPINNDYLVRYMYWVLNSAVFEAFIELTKTGTTINHLYQNVFAEFSFALPTLMEQKAITAFLDQETDRIDTLIFKKQRQLELLEEKRTALITHAVTKGLDPNVKMKDSGLEWLGEVPEHWEVASIKRVARISYGLGQPPKEMEDGIPLIRATDVSRGAIDPSKCLRVDPNDVPAGRNVFLEPGDIIIVRSGAYTGDSALVPNELAGAVAGYDMIVRCVNCVSQFLAYVFLGSSLAYQIDAVASRAAQDHLNVEQLGNCTVALPPTGEQRSIVRYLDDETTRIDALEDKIKQSIDTLQEYRAALIAAAVTGQIDVREEVV